MPDNELPKELQAGTSVLGPFEITRNTYSPNLGAEEEVLTEEEQIGAPPLLG
jgi:hypothetical protein